MSRNHANWYNKRGSSQKKLREIPHVTNVVDGTKRYYSAIDAELYFGDIFVDEVTNIVWSIQQQTLPLYGYNSYTFDDVAVGSRLIQGSFSINFTKSNFLIDLQNDRNFVRIARRMYGKDNKATTVFDDDFRHRLKLPLWDNGFDIVIGYGDQNGLTNLKNNLYSTYTILDCCQIVGSQTMLNYNGEPVQETYSFIARDITHKRASETELSPEKITKTNDSVKLEKYENIKIGGSIYIKNKDNALVSIVAENKILLAGEFNLLLDSDNSRILNVSRELNRGSYDNLCYEFEIDQTMLLKKELKKQNKDLIVFAKISCSYKDDKNSNESKNESKKIGLRIC